MKSEIELEERENNLEDQKKEENLINKGQEFNIMIKECLDYNTMKELEDSELIELGIITNQHIQTIQFHQNYHHQQQHQQENFQYEQQYHQQYHQFKRLYGEIVTLGYGSYQLLTNQNLIPKGIMNDKYQFQSNSNNLYDSSKYLICIHPTLQYTDNNNNNNNNNQFITLNESKMIYYHPDYSSNNIDIFQIGRCKSSINDWNVNGISTIIDESNKKGSVSKYSFRIVCERTPPYTCKIYAGGFNSSKELKLSNNNKLQWIEDNGNYVDGLTKYGVRIWNSLQKEWNEVTINGQILGPRRKLDNDDERIIPGEKKHSLLNILHDETIIDIGGSILLFRKNKYDRNQTSMIDEDQSNTFNSSLSSSQLSLIQQQDNNLEWVIKSLNDKHPICPVLLQPIQFPQSLCLKEKQLQIWEYVKNSHYRANSTRNTSLIESLIEKKSLSPKLTLSSTSPLLLSSKPFVFSACGHLYGYSKELEGRSCPLCRKQGPFVPLIICSESLICSDYPTHVFNPCGHAASYQTCKKWSRILLPDLSKFPSNQYQSPCCPFCLTKLKIQEPFNKLIVLFDT